MSRGYIGDMKMNVDEKLFTFDGAWSGNYYELYVQINSIEPKFLERALKRLWSHPTLSGCYLTNDVEPGEQKKLSINDIKLSRRRFYGLQNCQMVSKLLAKLLQLYTILNVLFLTSVFLSVHFVKNMTSGNIHLAIICL